VRRSPRTRACVRSLCVQRFASPPTAVVQTVQVQQLTAGGMDENWYSTMTIEKQRTIAKELVNYFNDRTYEREYLASRVFGWTTNAEITNGRWVMFGLLVRVPHPPRPTHSSLCERCPLCYDAPSPSCAVRPVPPLWVTWRVFTCTTVSTRAALYKPVWFATREIDGASGAARAGGDDDGVCHRAQLCGPDQAYHHQHGLRGHLRVNVSTAEGGRERSEGAVVWRGASV
jgi:hypothetical protein